MLPMVALRLALGTALAADSTTLAPGVTANKIALIKAPITLNENLVVADLTLADFTGATPISGTTGAQEVAVDPVTSDQLITIKPPLGGWRWVTTDSANLPQTIFGFALLDSTLATLLGVAILPAPITLNGSGQQIDLGSVTIQFVQQPMF